MIFLHFLIVVMDLKYPKNIYVEWTVPKIFTLGCSVPPLFWAQLIVKIGKGDISIKKLKKLKKYHFTNRILILPGKR